MTQSIVLDRFGGWELPDDPQEVGFNGAIDTGNVDLDRKGRLRTRDGYAKITATEGTNRYDSLHCFYSGSGGVDTLLAGAGNRLEAIDISDGSVDATSTAPTVSPHRFVTFGGSAGTAVYIANGTDQIRKYTTAAGFTAPAGLATITGKFLAVQTPDNRLVSAKGNRVSFSGPDTPEVFGADDWVDITPGDGESITAMVSWNHQVFVFKETKFAVFTGNSQDTTGGVVFNYRTVEGSLGGPAASAVALGQACATPEGVVYADLTGVYLTTGWPPQRISGGLDPLFRRYAPQYSSITSLGAPYAIAYLDRRLYAAYASAPGPTTSLLVYDFDTRRWLKWDVAAQALAVIRNNVSALPPAVAFAYLSATKDIAKFGAASTTDDGVAISWYYQSGFADLGTPEVKDIKEASLWGSGTVTLKMAVDHGTVDTGTALTLGTAPTVGEAVQTFTRTGTFFSYRLSGSGVASVNRLLFYATDPRPTGSRI